jgi:ureidoglycolate dehydrogenase (NAD+)
MYINIDSLLNFTALALEHAGAESSEARAKAEMLVWADRIGRDTQGLWRLEILVERLQAGLHPSPAPMTYERKAPSIGMLNGGNGLGYIVAAKAMEHAINMAKEQGVGAVCVRNASHLGAAGYYVNQAAQDNMLGVCMSNSFPKVIPPGSNQRVIGTNPLAFSAPRKNREAMIVDFATASSAGSTVTEASEAGEQLEEDAGFDSQGNPTTDPAKIHLGGMAPMGGAAKGFGLGLMVEVLSGVITGAGIANELRSFNNDFSGPANNGHFMLALNPATLMTLEDYYIRIERLINQIEAAGSRFPGQLRWKQYHESAVVGVKITPQVQKRIINVAKKLGLEFPW